MTSIKRHVGSSDELLSGVTPPATDTSQGAVYDLVDAGAVLTSSSTLVANKVYRADSTSGNLALTLPTSANIGSRVVVKHVTQAGANIVTVTCAGSDVFNKTGGPPTYVLSLVNQSVILQKAAGGIWIAVNDLGLTNVNNTNDANKPVSTAQQTALDLRRLKSTETRILAADYGVVADGTTINNSTLAAASAAAHAAGATLELPRGTIRVTSQVTFTNQNVVGGGRKSTIISVTASLGSGVPAMVFTNDAGGGTLQPTLTGFSVVGPGARSLGVKTAICDGIAIQGQIQPYLLDVEIRGFDSGLVCNNDVGHIYLEHCNLTDNYYGVYVQKNTGDFYFHNSTINGNTFANFATSAVAGFDSAVWENCHMGFAPYSVYMEAGTPLYNGVFMQDATFRHSRFESVGNACIFSDATDSPSNFSQFASVRIEDPGHSWSNTYKIPGRARDYAISVGTLNRTIVVDSGSAPFLPGDVGRFYAARGTHTAWTTLSSGGGSTTDLVIGSGNTNYFPGARPATSYDIAISGNGVNLLSSNDASFETDVSGWQSGGNATVGRSTAQYLNGTASLSMTAVADGNVNAQLASGHRVSVSPNSIYSALASIKAGATSRQCRIVAQFYTAGGATTGGQINSPSVANSTSGWVQASLMGVSSPSDAASLQVNVQAISAVTGELHYVDAVAIVPGITAYWQPGQVASAIPAMTYRSGLYYGPPGNRSTSSRNNGVMTLIPFRAEAAFTFTILAIEVVTTPASAGGLVRLGVYADSSGQPGALILDAGTVDPTTTGLKTITGLTLNLAPGWYYLAAAVQGNPTTTPVMRSINPGNAIPGAPIYTASGSSLNSAAGWNQGSVTGALPSTAAAGTTDTAILVALAS